MRAGSAEGEKFVAAPREQHRLFAHVTSEHAAIGKVARRDAEPEIRPGRV